MKKLLLIAAVLLMTVSPLMAETVTRTTTTTPTTTTDVKAPEPDRESRILCLHGWCYCGTADECNFLIAWCVGSQDNDLDCYGYNEQGECIDGGCKTN